MVTQSRQCCRVPSSALCGTAVATYKWMFCSLQHFNFIRKLAKQCFRSIISKKKLNCKRKFYAIIINYARDNVARFFTTFLIVVYCRHQCCFYSSCKKEECPVCHIKVKFIYFKKLRLFMLKKFKYFQRLFTNLQLCNSTYQAKTEFSVVYRRFVFNCNSLLTDLFVYLTSWQIRNFFSGSGLGQKWPHQTPHYHTLLLYCKRTNDNKFQHTQIFEFLGNLNYIYFS